MFDQFKDLWKFKNQMAEIKKHMDNMVIKASSPNHVFEITITGSQEIKEVTVAENFKDFPREKIGEELTAVINKAIKDSQAMAAQALGGAAMSMDLPKA